MHLKCAEMLTIVALETLQLKTSVYMEVGDPR